ncbi:hypothetical protein ES705_50857 [subsurface metagenome]
MKLLRIVYKELYLFAVGFQKMLRCNFKGFIDTFANGYTGHNNNELTPAVALIHLENSFYIAVSLSGTGFHLNIKVYRRYFCFYKCVALRQILISLNGLNIFQYLRLG